MMTHESKCINGSSLAALVLTNSGFILVAMAWKSLRDSHGSKPLVLTGPMRRKVTPASVTVWHALRRPGAVTLKVLDTNGNRVMEGKRRAPWVRTFRNARRK